MWMWFLTLWISSFWTHILRLNVKKNVEKVVWERLQHIWSQLSNVNKIYAKSSSGRHVGGQEYALQHDGQYKWYSLGTGQKV